MSHTATSPRHSTSLSVTLLLLAYSPTFPSCPAILFTLMLLRTLCNELGLWVSSQPLTSGGSSYEDNEVCVVIGRRQLRQMAVVAMKQSSDNEESIGDWTKTAPPDGSCRYEAVIRQRRIYWWLDEDSSARWQLSLWSSHQTKNLLVNGRRQLRQMAVVAMKQWRGK